MSKKRIKISEADLAKHAKKLEDKLHKAYRRFLRWNALDINNIHYYFEVTKDCELPIKVTCLANIGKYEITD